MSVSASYCLSTLAQSFLDLQCKHLKGSVFLIISSSPAPAILLNVFLSHVGSGFLGSALRDACIIFGQQFWGLCMKGKPRPGQAGLRKRERARVRVQGHGQPPGTPVPLAQLEISLKHGKLSLSGTTLSDASDLIVDGFYRPHEWLDKHGLSK